MKRLVLGISGKARHGKDTAADFVQKCYEEKGYKVVKLPLATYIKKYAMFLGWDGREETKPRELLQKLGTEVIKQEMNKKLFHAERIAEDIDIMTKAVSKDILFIIPDVRFKSEVNYLKAYFQNEFKILRVVRHNFDNGLTEEQKNHLSEIDLDDYDDFDYYAWNDLTLDDFYTELKQILGL